jgi:hypothetical protein
MLTKLVTQVVFLLVITFVTLICVEYNVAIVIIKLSNIYQRHIWLPSTFHTQDCISSKCNFPCVVISSCQFSSTSSIVSHTSNSWSPSYGQKKGQESNWQFDSRPLKVGNQPLPTSDLKVRHGVGKISTRATTLVQTSLRSDFTVGSYELPKFRKSNWDNFRVPFRESQEFVPFGCSLHCELQRIWAKMVASPESGPWWVLCVKVPVPCPNTQGCSWMLTNLFWLVFGCRFTQHKLVPLPSLIPGLPTWPSTPF